jgi:hypothetical protein
MLATVRTRSRPFAQTTYLQRLRVGRANASEPGRTPTAAIAAIVIGATFNSRGPVSRPRTSDRRRLRLGRDASSGGQPCPYNSARPNLRTLRVGGSQQQYAVADDIDCREQLPCGTVYPDPTGALPATSLVQIATPSSASFTRCAGRRARRGCHGRRFSRITASPHGVVRFVALDPEPSAALFRF